MSLGSTAIDSLQGGCQSHHIHQIQGHLGRGQSGTRRQVLLGKQRDPLQDLTSPGPGALSASILSSSLTEFKEAHTSRKHTQWLRKQPGERYGSQPLPDFCMLFDIVGTQQDNSSHFKNMHHSHFLKWLQRTWKEVGSKHCIFQSIKWNTFLKEAEINLHVKMELPSLYVMGMFLKSYIHK